MGVSQRESNLKVDSLFASGVCSYLSPSGKDSWEAGTNEGSVTGPPQGDSKKEFGAARSKPFASELAEAIVLKGHEQSSPKPSDEPKAHLKGHGEPRASERVTGKVTPNESNPNRPFHGTLRREEVFAALDCRVKREGNAHLGAEDSVSSTNRPESQTSFWEKTLPTNNWWELSRSGLPMRSQPQQQVESEEHHKVNDFEMRGGLENIDLATEEREMKDEKRFDPKGRGDHSWLEDIPKGGDSKNDQALLRARRRNALRLKKANEADLNIISKYLPSDAAVFFPCGIEGPDDFHEVRSDWLEALIRVVNSSCPIPKAPHVKFGTTPSDLDHNTKYLEDCGWDFEEVFARHKQTTVDHGSEFRPVEDLRVILGRHPFFESLADMFQRGFEYHLDRELSEEERAAELSAQLVRGNHKSATESEEEVQLLLEGDVRHGFVLPVWDSALLRVKGCQLQPGGMVRQLSLKADGSRKIKNRFTHDLSFAINSADASINARVDMSRYTDMVYGWCFQRILHYLAALRANHPEAKIYLAKFDYSDAYKRISQSPKATAATVVRFGRIAYFCWRMVFGGSPNPAGFSCFSETLTDLANEIAMSSYHPRMGTSDTIQQTHLVPKEVEDPGAPIEPAIMPALIVSTRLTSYRDCFIDDVIDCHLGTPQNLERAPHIVQLAVQAMSRPHAGGEEEPVPRRPLLGPEKLEAEGRSSERQIVLGWEIQTRAFVVALPFDKHKAWTEDLGKLVHTGQATQQETESMIGRLNHASFLIPLSRHFLNEVRAKCLSVPRRKGQHIRFTEEELNDLKLWLEFLNTAKGGISINLLVLRTPTRIAWSDSCPFGLGGYTIKGTAWRIRVPSSCSFYGDDSVNNVLELLGMAISVLLLLKEARDDAEKFPCLLVLGDNTSAISWLYKSGRVPRSSRYYPIVKAIARRIALEVTKGSAQLCSQHIAGSMNVIADLLSFEGRCRQQTNPLTEDCPPNDALTHRILNHHSQIVPSGFKIQRLPREVESFAFSMMLTIAKSWSPKENRPTSGTTGTGGDGELSSEIGGWAEMPSSIRYPESMSEYYWLEDSSCHAVYSTSIDRARLLQSVRNQWYRRLFEMPLAAWHRRSGNVDGRAPSTSRSESMAKDRFIPR